ncbi:BZ3500_MvSof-1268-A1-R1_Chr4-3g07232 [Microbotryum saponariae]|uniref:BZ3500_MvSof-1268-A1-R1_Chr4-3g07232 protein n=1 Tax=Microbotryum saponariae TaxID=289078 RepID=A0A2X0MCD9_9BASI|nr:BZ3500_MvSof-1268-A1-R1_Chr4-3g07232 [Microbotryum saponariae]SDA06895.1 BZ3501_MvSof-1269-A2-R1_Chr4-2g06941 [Microbotryum saponariae]
MTRAATRDKTNRPEQTALRRFRKKQSPTAPGIVSAFSSSFHLPYLSEPLPPSRDPMSRLRPSSLPSRTPSSTPPRISTVALGTAYELATLQFLSQPPLSLQSLLRIGGANDKGIDLRGFYIPQRPVDDDANDDMVHEGSVQRRRLRPRRYPILVQCKAVSKPLQPSIVREFEGVLSTEPGGLGILVGMNGFTESAIKRALASELPMGLLRLGKGVLGREFGAGSEAGVVGEEEKSWDFGVNKAMRELVGEDVGGWLIGGMRRKWSKEDEEMDGIEAEKGR